jgi:hypothetical protein
LLFRRSIHASDDDLSAYLDGRLAAATRERIDGHLSGCAICQRALEGLRAVRSALQGLPAVRAPRSFTLREADVRPAARGAMRAMPLLSGMTAAAMLAFFGLVGFDIAGGGSSSSSSASRVAMPAAMGAASDAAKSLGPSRNTELAMTATFAYVAGLPNSAQSMSTPATANDSAFADQTGTLAFRVAPSVVTPVPASPVATSESSSNDMGMHVAEAALASMALASGAGVIIVSRRRNS